MLIRHKDWMGRTVDSTIAAYVEKTITQTEYSGIAEDARRIAEQNAEVTGRLVERLVKKGVLDGRDVMYIADGYEKDAEIINA